MSAAERLVASIDAKVVALHRAEDRIHELQSALNRMVLAHDDLRSNTEGRYPEPDAGCVECTVGTVPDKYNTGLCAYHNAKKLLGQL